MANKKVVIMRGISGAGKSTYIKNHFPGAFVCSADSYFYNENGEYTFNPSLLGQAHQNCKKQFIKAIKKKFSLIVIDNTNTKMWEMKPYINIAREAGYDIMFIRLNTPVGIAVAMTLR